MLNDNTLVLNKSWVAISVTSVRKAFSLLCRNTAFAVKPDNYSIYNFDDWLKLQVRDGEPFVQGISRRYKIPEVIILSKYELFPQKHISFCRQNVLRRDHYTCQYCGTRPGSKNLTIDHIVPISRGGSTSWLNCVTACTRCNTKKGNNTPQSAGLQLRSMPRIPAWTPHFAIPKKSRKASWIKFITSGVKSGIRNMSKHEAFESVY